MSRVTGEIDEVAVRARLLSVEYIDEAEDRSDTMRLRLSDRPVAGSNAVIAWPDKGKELVLSLGYKETGLVDFGRFRVDDVGYSGPPDVVEIQATAAGLSQKIRARRERSWHRTTLGEIAEKVAANHDLEPVVDSDLAAVSVPHVDQRAEGDIAFVNRLARMHDGVAKPVDGKLVLMSRGKARGLFGADPAVTVIKPHQVTRWRYTEAGRRDPGRAGSEGGVRAFWWDHGEGKRREYKTGSEPYEDLPRSFHSEREARAAVSERSNSGQRTRSVVNFTMSGDPSLQTEALLVLENWRPNIPPFMRITRVVHNIGPRGYTVQVQAEERPDQIDVADTVNGASDRVEDTL